MNTTTTAATPLRTRRSLDIGVYGARGIPSTYSGYETFLTTLLPELVRRGDRVTIYCRPGDGMENTDWQGVQRRVVAALPGKNLNTLSHGLLAGLAARRHRHDVLLVVNVANAPFCFLGRRTGQPVVLNVDGQEWERTKWGPLARAVFRGSARIARHCATGLIADGPSMADIYRERFGSDSTVIPYCQTDLDWTPDPSSLHRFGVEPGRYLMIAGRHNPENNLDRVAALLSASDIDLPLLVLGAANYRSPVTTRLEQLAAADPRIRAIGHVGDRRHFFDLIHHAAVYLHGHSVGGTNPSLVEAMAVGGRICALDNVFNRDTLGAAGRYFRLDPPNLVETIGGLLGEPAEVQLRSRKEAVERAAEDYSVDAVTDAYRTLLHAAAAAGRHTVALPTRWRGDATEPTVPARCLPPHAAA